MPPHFFTPSASSAWAFTSSCTATTSSTPSSPRWQSEFRITNCMNCFSIRHLTRYRYSRSVSESIMETRMHPRSDSNQHCLTFSLSVSPRCRVFTYRDHQGNNVQHFDIPGDHSQLVIIAESVVEQQPLPDVPSFLSLDAWRALDELVRAG